MLEFWHTLWHTHTLWTIMARIGVCLLVPVSWALGNEAVVAFLAARRGKAG